MPQFFDYDPVKGVTEYFDYDENTGEAHIITECDAEPVLKRAHALRESDAWRRGVKENFALYAYITPVMEIEMRHRGIRLSDPNATQAILKCINERFPHARATNAWEGRKKRKL